MQLHQECIHYHNYNHKEVYQIYMLLDPNFDFMCIIILVFIID